MFWDILRKDLKRKKTINIVILLFIILVCHVCGKRAEQCTDGSKWNRLLS